MSKKETKNIAVQPDDYVILRHRGAKKLCLVLNSKQAVIESTLIGDADPENISFDADAVVCNLGQNPEHGTYNGVKVTPYRRTISSGKFGPIEIYCDIEKKDLGYLKSAMETVFKQFGKKASTAFLPLTSVKLFPKKGKYAGSYTAKTKGTETYDFISFHPESYSDEVYNQYLVAHEFAHGLWYRCVPMQIRVKWMKLYQKRLKLSSVDGQRLGELWRDVLEADDRFTGYRKQVENDDDQLILKEVAGWFKRNHRMAPNDIDLMLSHDSEALFDLWPTTAALINERQDISSYSLKSVEEFFAEAVAYDMAGRILPKDVAKALTTTYKVCKQAG